MNAEFAVDIGHSSDELSENFLDHGRLEGPMLSQIVVELVTLVPRGYSLARVCILTRPEVILTWTIFQDQPDQRFGYDNLV